MKFSVSELSEVIRHRRTIYPKDLTDREVHREVLEKVLTNATWAPTHGMTQPWRFHVFTGGARQRLSTFLGETYTRLTPEDKFLPKKHAQLMERPVQSSAVIAVVLAHDASGKISEQDDMLAVACAVQNMHLTCAAYGLGGFWATGAILLGDAMRGFLGLGPGERSLGLFFIGYPAIPWPKGYRRPLDQVVTWIDQ